MATAQDYYITYKGRDYTHGDIVQRRFILQFNSPTDKRIERLTARQVIDRFDKPEKSSHRRAKKPKRRKLKSEIPLQPLKRRR